MPEKINLRKTFLKIRDSLPEEERAKKSAQIKEILFRLPEFKQARTIMFYVSFGSEVQTEPMIRETLKSGKNVVVPALGIRERHLIPAQILDCEGDLELGRYGIREPKKECLKEISPNQIDLIIVPGIAFDLAGHRVGFGVGYYDRFFEGMNPKTSVIGLAYEAQIVDRLPTRKHDIPVHKIITERRLIKIGLQ